MRCHLPGIGPIGVIVLLSGCASPPPATTAAARVERMQCDGSATAQDEAQLLRSTAVLRIQPLYSHVTSYDNAEERVNGAKLLIRPPKGMSAEQLTRVLQCHSARVLLGRANPADIPDDPYWLPDRWVNIQVQPEDGNFAVTVSADSVHDNLQVFGRARHYADDHMLATDPGLP